LSFFCWLSVSSATLFSGSSSSFLIVCASFALSSRRAAATCASNLGEAMAAGTVFSSFLFIFGIRDSLFFWTRAACSMVRTFFFSLLTYFLAPSSALCFMIGASCFSRFVRISFLTIGVRRSVSVLLRSRTTLSTNSLVRILSLASAVILVFREATAWSAASFSTLDFSVAESGDGLLATIFLTACFVFIRSLGLL